MTPALAPVAATSPAVAGATHSKPHSSLDPGSGPHARPIRATPAPQGAQNARRRTTVRQQPQLAPNGASGAWLIRAEDSSRLQVRCGVDLGRWRRMWRVVVGRCVIGVDGGQRVGLEQVRGRADSVRDCAGWPD